MARAAAATVPGTGGYLLIVGGGSQPADLVAKFVELAGGPGKARIAVLPMASGEVAVAGKEKAEQLQGLGADAFVVITGGDGANSDSVVRLLDGATGIWFNGGDQSRLVAAIAGTRVLAAVHARYRAGAVIGGTSAGAAIMSDSMITGDQVRPDSTGYYGDDYPAVARRTIVVTAGFGFLPGTVVDQHFLRRERHNRLLSVVLERPSLIGIGVDEGTAVLVHPTGIWEVLGRSAAVVYDARRARITQPERGALGATEVRLHLLPAGATFDPRSGLASLPTR
jgi:cyanophycinase